MMLATLLSAACADGPGGGSGPVPVASVTIIAIDSVLSPMESSQFQAEVQDTAGSLMLRAVTWSVSDTQVAVVDSLGLLRARADGSVHLVADVDGVRDSVPIRVTRSFTEISVGETGTCALGVDSTGYCWGYPRGTLAPLLDTLAPSVVAGGLSWLSIDIGIAAACGVAADHAAYCWGDNAYSHLGVDVAFGRNVQEPAPVRGGLSFDSVNVGMEHTCGLAVGGAAWCWGRNKYGEIGDSSPAFRQKPQPVAVYGAGNWRAIVANGYATCGLTTANIPLCWGHNLNGYLGVDSTDQGDILAPRPVQTPETFADIAIGGDHQCALAPGGAAFCWGYNTQGNLGSGVFSTIALTPQPVIGGHHFTQLTAGAFHACGIAADGTAWCWGEGAVTPTLVPGGHTFVRIAAGRSKSCGVTAGGAGYCWAAPAGVPTRLRDP